MWNCLHQEQEQTGSMKMKLKVFVHIYLHAVSYRVHVTKYKNKKSISDKRFYEINSQRSWFGAGAAFTAADRTTNKRRVFHETQGRHLVPTKQNSSKPFTKWFQPFSFKQVTVLTQHSHILMVIRYFLQYKTNIKLPQADVTAEKLSF